MKYTTKTMTLGGKTYQATQVDYDSYSTESGTIEVDDVTLKAVKAIGEESNDE